MHRCQLQWSWGNQRREELVVGIQVGATHKFLGAQAAGVGKKDYLDKTSFFFFGSGTKKVLCIHVACTHLLHDRRLPK